MRKNVLFLAAFAVCMTGMLAADFVMPDRIFSVQENRRLAQRPKAAAASCLDGSFMEQYEAYVSDQLPARNAFIAAAAQMQRLIGKKDVNGVYFAPDNTLIERHEPESVDVQKAERKRERLVGEAAKIREMVAGQTGVMIVPSADAVSPQRLPAFAESFDQLSWIRMAQQKAEEAGISVVDVSEALRRHEEEYIYYGTDHHWTTLGAFYGYQAFTQAFGLPGAELSDYEKIVVKEDFWGTLQAKINLQVRQDEIFLFERPGEGEHPTSFIYEEREAPSCYFYERLQTKDAYAFFLDGNYPVAEIKGEGPAEKTILLIKDSYANCFAPFLTRDYGTIWLVDRRYYRKEIAELIREYEPEDVLYLYNIFQFIESF